MRIKIFILVSILFCSAIFGLIALRYVEVDKTILKITSEISNYIKMSDIEKRSNILEYLNVSVTEIESKIQAIFDKIDQLEWLEKRFLPSNYKMYADHWQDSSVLMMTNPWIDLIQTTAGDQLASSIIARPPYLDTFIHISVTPTLSVIAEVGDNCKSVAYIGVPYWTGSVSNVNGALRKNDVASGDKEDDFLFFSIDDLLSIDVNSLKTKNVNWNSNPFDIFRGIPHTAYVKLMSNVIESIKLIQEELKNQPDLIAMLTTPIELDKWITKKIEMDPKLIKKIDSKCRNKVCCGWTSVIEKDPWNIEEGWDYRNDQNQFIWKLGFLFGSGIWNFDPLGEKAPKGICNFTKVELRENKSFVKGGGILINKIVRKEIIPFHSDCIPRNENSCSSEQFQIEIIPDSEGVFYTKTMVFKSKGLDDDSPVYGTMTIGVSINEVLQQLALIIPGSILFIKESGEKVFFDEHGNISTTSSWDDIDFSKFTSENTGVIKNIGGKEFLFIHFVPNRQGEGQVFVVELKQDVFTLLYSLKKRAEQLIHKLIIENTALGAIALLISLLILNYILKRGIEPLTKLAETTKLIATGNLENITIQDSWKKRRDEIGLLCEAFDQMIQEMKEGLKVRSILNKVVSKEIADKIIKDGVQLGGEIRNVTILFADIRNFTQISEAMDPAEVLEMLNSCLNVLSRVIDEHKGIIDKYIGDEIMAIFGAPVLLPDEAFQAILCAKNMMYVLKEWNEIRKERNLPSLEIGISIHTGPVIAGNIGAENHLSYTVIGHNVNLASRIARHAKGMEILISEETFNSPNVSEKILCEPVEYTSFKGISKQSLLYRVVL